MYYIKNFSTTIKISKYIIYKNFSIIIFNIYQFLQLYIKLKILGYKNIYII